MTAFAPLPSLDILERFFAFVAEMERLRRLAERPSTPPPTAAGGDFPSFLLDAPVAAIDRAAPPPPSPEADPERLQEHLQAYIEADIRDYARQGTELMVAQFREAQYAMAALADDLFLHEVDWQGRDIWRFNHLEHRVFQSRLAGDRIFERIEALLATNDRRLNQLASVYLCVLSLGFKGRYRGGDGEAALRSHAERLFRLIAGREPALLSEWPERLRQPVIPSAYAHTVSGDRAHPGYRRPDWRLAVAAVGLAWLLGGEILWLSASAPIAEAAAAVLRPSGDHR